MATGSRVLWKGAITFGLVHVPVGLHTATQEQGVDFDWLDKRSMDPVGYKRINKRTGQEVERENIVKGVAYEEGHYVILSPEEVQQAYPRTTQTIEILRFVDSGAIPFVYLERPYYVTPIDRGEKVYALLRDTLARTGKVGLAKVVIQTKQHLAALVPSGPVLVLNLMRWGDQVKPLDGLELPGEGKTSKPSASEVRMATQLIEEMSGPWEAEAFQDEFTHAIMRLVEKKVKAGKTETVLEPEEEAPTTGAEVIDLAELLARSLKGQKPPARAAGKTAGKTGAKTEARTAAKSTTKPADGAKPAKAGTRAASTRASGAGATSAPAKKAAAKASAARKKTSTAQAPRERKAA